jgi:hypothetical protein
MFRGPLVLIAALLLLSSCGTSPYAVQSDIAAGNLEGAAKRLEERRDGDPDDLDTRLEPRLDPGDRSALGEILLPQLAISVRVKKADYTIEELGTLVQSRAFKITQVTRGQVPSRAPKGCSVVRVDMQEMRDYLFRTRKQQDFPDPVLIERLAGIRGVPDVEAIADELTERYGPLPALVDTLLRVMELRRWLKDLRIVRARRRGPGVVLEFDPGTSVRPEGLAAVAQASRGRVRLVGPAAVEMRPEAADHDGTIAELRALLQRLAAA